MNNHIYIVGVWVNSTRSILKCPIESIGIEILNPWYHHTRQTEASEDKKWGEGGVIKGVSNRHLYDHISCF